MKCLFNFNNIVHIPFVNINLCCVYTMPLCRLSTSLVSIRVSNSKFAQISGYVFASLPFQYLLTYNSQIFSWCLLSWVASVSFRHRLEEGQASSWSRRLKFFMCCTRAKDTQSVRLKHYLKYTHASYCESISYTHTQTHTHTILSRRFFSLRMLILRWPACLPSFSGIWTSCRVTSSLAWCSFDRDNELRDQPSWIRFAESWHCLISFITFDWTNIPQKIVFLFVCRQTTTFWPFCPGCL